MIRLIDANELFDKVGQISPENKQQYEDIGMFMNMITNSPTVEARPEGKWIPDTARAYTEDEDTWECSVCHEPFTLIEGTPEDNLYNYCPKCGAKLTYEPE